MSSLGLARSATDIKGPGLSDDKWTTGIPPTVVEPGQSGVERGKLCMEEIR